MASPRARARALFVKPELRPRAPAAHLPGAGPKRPGPGPVFRIREAADLARIPFQDGVAAVELPVDLLESVRFANDQRARDTRARALEASIRARGYSPVEPIIAALTPDGSWDIVDGGHRINAVRRIMHEIWTNLWGPRVRTLYILLFQSRADADPA